MFDIYRPSFRGMGAIGVLIAWVATLGWLGVRQLHRTEASTLSSEATMRLAPGTVWYALYAGSTQIGNASITLDTLSPGYQVSEAVVLETPSGAGLARGTRRTEVWLGATLNLERMHSRYSRAGRQTNWAISVFGDTITAHFVSDSLRTQGRALFDNGPIAGSALPYRLALGGGLVTGHSAPATLLDGWPPAGFDTRITVGRESLVRFADSSHLERAGGHFVAAHFDSVRAMSVTLTGALGPRRLWVDHRGTVVGVETPLGLRWARTDFDLSETDFRKTVTQRIPAIRAAVPVMLQYATSMQVADTGTGQRRFLVRHRDGSPVDTALLGLLGGGRQRVRGDTLVIAAATEPQPDASTADTTVDPMIQSGAGAISTALHRIADVPVGRATLGAFLVRFRALARVDTSASRAEDALGTLSNRVGRPDGVVRLFVALVRASGARARFVVGVYPSGETMLTHAWAELWSAETSSWQAVDPLSGSESANTGLIRLAFAGSSHPDDMLALIANARLTPLGGKEAP